MISTITLYNSEEEILAHTSYRDHLEMRGILDQWGKEFKGASYYQVNPKLSNLIKVEPTTKRGKILLNSLKLAG